MIDALLRISAIVFAMVFTAHGAMAGWNEDERIFHPWVVTDIEDPVEGTISYRLATVTQKYRSDDNVRMFGFDCFEDGAVFAFVRFRSMFTQPGDRQMLRVRVGKDVPFSMTGVEGKNGIVWHRLGRLVDFDRFVQERMIGRTGQIWVRGNNGTHAGNMDAPFGIDGFGSTLDDFRAKYDR